MRPREPRMRGAGPGSWVPVTETPGLVVVGSGPAGLAAVRAFREREAAAPVIMITAGSASARTPGRR